MLEVRSGTSTCAGARLDSTEMVGEYFYYSGDAIYNETMVISLIRSCPTLGKYENTGGLSQFIV